MNRLAAASAVSLALAASSAQAQVPAPPPMPHDGTVHRHLGFALRLDGGVGYLRSSSSPGDMSIKGGGGLFGIVVGGAVSENFILGGELWDAVAVRRPSAREACPSRAPTRASPWLGWA